MKVSNGGNVSGQPSAPEEGDIDPTRSMSITTSYESGQIQVGSFNDEITFRVTSDSRVCNDANDVYTVRFRDIAVEQIKADGTKTVYYNEYYSNGHYIFVRTEGIDDNTFTIKMTGMGQRFSSSDIEGTFRIRLYDDNREEYVYSNNVTVQLGGYNAQTTVTVGNCVVDGNGNVTEMKAGVENQVATYKVTATAMPSYNSQATFEWCDADGNVVSEPVGLVGSVSRNDYDSETAGGGHYTVTYSVVIKNTQALSDGIYYFKITANNVTSEVKPLKVLSGGSMSITTSYESGQIQVGSFNDEITFRVTSDSRVCNDANDVYTVRFRDIAVEQIKADGTKTVYYNEYYSNGHYIFVRTEGIDDNTFTIKMTGMGQRFSSSDIEGTFRIRLYDDNREEYVYSNNVTVQLGGYNAQTTVTVGNCVVDGNGNVTEMKAGVENQVATYKVTATAMPSYNSQATFEWCDADGNVVSEPVGLVGSVSRNDYDSETAGGGHYTVTYSVVIKNTQALSDGIYYFKITANDVESLPQTFVIK